MPFFSTIRIEEEIRAPGNSLQNLHVHNRIGAGGREGTGPLLPSIAGKKNSSVQVKTKISWKWLHKPHPPQDIPGPCVPGRPRKLIPHAI